MKSLSLLSSAAALLLFFLSAGAAFGQQQQREQPRPDDLQLNMSVVGQQSCAVSADVDALRLTLQLRYTNAGKEKLILYKGNRLFFQLFVAKGVEGAATGRSELRATHSRYFDEQPEKIEAPNPTGVFVTLPPGASYETRQVVSLPVARSGEGRVNVSIGAGAHVLSVAASTWYESRKLSEELRARWRARGFLWVDPVVSNAVAFGVEKERATVACR
jgi:hypothetical protein